MRLGCDLAALIVLHRSSVYHMRALWRILVKVIGKSYMYVRLDALTPRQRRERLKRPSLACESVASKSAIKAVHIISCAVLHLNAGQPGRTLAQGTASIVGITYSFRLPFPNEGQVSSCPAGLGDFEDASRYSMVIISNLQ
jgi:hypothetical protein